MSSEGVRSSVPQWKMRLKVPDDFPDIAKFSDGDINLKGAVQPVKMFLKEEDIKEDEQLDVVKDAEYYKRRRQRRKRYRKKNVLYLQDSSQKVTGQPYTGLNYEGQLVNLGTAEFESVQTYKSSLMKEAQDEMAFKYVLLQFVKRTAPDSGSEVMEINVIPVGDMYAFRKTTISSDATLAEIEQQFEEEERRKQVNFSSFGHIQKLLDSSDSKLLKSEQSAGIGSFETVSNTNKRKSKAPVGANGSIEAFIDEDGADIDQNEEFNEWCKGDYAVRYADDEEVNVEYEQAKLNILVDAEVTQNTHHEDDFVDVDSDDDENDPKSREGVDSGDGDQSHGNYSDTGAIVFDENMEKSLMEGRKVLELTTNMKRGRDEKADKSVRVSFANDAVANGEGFGLSSVAGDTSAERLQQQPQGKKARIEVAPAIAGGSTASSSSISANVSLGYDLSVQGVRKYIIDRGGKVSISEIEKVLCNMGAYTSIVDN
jgi:hypothetical protein